MPLFVVLRVVVFPALSEVIVSQVLVLTNAEYLVLVFFGMLTLAI